MACSKHLGVLRDEVTDACRGPSRDRLDVVRKTIVAVVGMELGHGQQVVEDVVRQTASSKLPVSPLLQRHIDVSDGSAEGIGIFRRHGLHVF